ncbi:MAG TPA: hypothetical protein VMZ51_04895 [Acidimicrobiales bacterium]|nr:hypothetical protein [Acidimicrobiales bacterium]
MSLLTMVHGEELRVPERVILAPALGVFEPTTPEGETATEAEGRLVTEGQVVGVVNASGKALPVRSAFTGFLMGMLAHPGERVREGQPVAWLRVV